MSKFIDDKTFVFEKYINSKRLKQNICVMFSLIIVLAFFLIALIIYMSITDLTDTSKLIGLIVSIILIIAAIIYLIYLIFKMPRKLPLNISLKYKKSINDDIGSSEEELLFINNDNSYASIQ
ncbi:hypothetical protein MHBO_004715 [Bonamia ostreae]|uniref:Uncharacterized protein n=1 Tax=Bonamia ostreae TaxID=126728 RepID=A0ABV2AU28_9EUKA